MDKGIFAASVTAVVSLAVNQGFLPTDGSLPALSMRACSNMGLRRGAIAEAAAACPPVEGVEAGPFLFALVLGSAAALGGAGGRLFSLRALLEAPERADDAECRTALEAVAKMVGDKEVDDAWFEAARKIVLGRWTSGVEEACDGECGAKVNFEAVRCDECRQKSPLGLPTQGDGDANTAKKEYRDLDWSRPSAKVSAVPLAWDSAVATAPLDGGQGSTGAVLAVELKDAGLVVVKTGEQHAAGELAAALFGRALGLNVPETRAVASDSDEGKALVAGIKASIGDIMQQIISGAVGTDAPGFQDYMKLDKINRRPYTLIMECLKGKALKATDIGDCNMREVGRVCIFDMVIHYGDRIPTVFDNAGNAGNLLISSDGTVGVIDQQIFFNFVPGDELADAQIARVEAALASLFLEEGWGAQDPVVRAADFFKTIGCDLSDALTAELREGMRAMVRHIGADVERFAGEARRAKAEAAAVFADAAGTEAIGVEYIIRIMELCAAHV
jgi:hypothetical protein